MTTRIINGAKEGTPSPPPTKRNGRISVRRLFLGIVALAVLFPAVQLTLFARTDDGGVVADRSHAAPNRLPKPEETESAKKRRVTRVRYRRQTSRELQDKINDGEDVVGRQARSPPNDGPPKKARDDDGPVETLDGTAVLSNSTFRYRYPRTLTEPTESGIVVGVLSTDRNAERRETIRTTWAKGRRNVFFIVAGDWDLVKRESEQFRDMIWLDTEEAYRKITYKTLLFLTVADAHADPESFEYALKTDDDSYVALERTEEAISESGADYWGKCTKKMRPVRKPKTHPNYVSYEEYPHDWYPPYASGAGYALSKSFVRCAAEKLKTAPYNINEDCSTGILGEMCNVTCVRENRISATRPKALSLKSDFLIHHYVKKDMERVHELHLPHEVHGNKTKYLLGDGSLSLEDRDVHPGGGGLSPAAARRHRDEHRPPNPHDQWCPRAKCATSVNCRPCDRRFLIEIATGRSGSTSLMSMLNQLPGLRMSGENNHALGGIRDMMDNLINNPDHWFKFNEMKGSWGHGHIHEQDLACPAQRFVEALNPPLLVEQKKPFEERNDDSLTIIGFKTLRFLHGWKSDKDAVTFLQHYFPCFRAVININSDTARQAKSQGKFLKHKNNATELETMNERLRNVARLMGSKRAIVMDGAEWTDPKSGVHKINDMVKWLGFRNCNFPHLIHDNQRGYKLDKQADGGVDLGSRCRYRRDDTLGKLSDGATTIVGDDFPREARKRREKERKPDCSKYGLTPHRNNELEFVHVTKTGGSAILNAGKRGGVIWGACHFYDETCHCPDMERGRPTKEVPDAYFSKVFNDWHVPPKLFVENPYGNRTLFTAVRDPYDRMVSEFYCPWVGPKGDTDKGDPGELNKFVRKSIRRYLGDRVKLGYMHFYPQHHYVYDDDGRRYVKHVLRYENLTAEFNELMTEYGMEPRMEEGAKRVNSARTVGIRDGKEKLTGEDLDRETVELINDFYRKDFELFGYKMRDPNDAESEEVADGDKKVTADS